MKKQKRKGLSIKVKAMLIILLIPIAVTVFTLTAIIWTGLKNPELIRKSASALLDIGERHTANDNSGRVHPSL